MSEARRRHRKVCGGWPSVACPCWDDNEVWDGNGVHPKRATWTVVFVDYFRYPLSLSPVGLWLKVKRGWLSFCKSVLVVKNLQYHTLMIPWKTFWIPKVAPTKTQKSLFEICWNHLQLKHHIYFCCVKHGKNRTLKKIEFRNILGIFPEKPRPVLVGRTADLSRALLHVRDWAAHFGSPVVTMGFNTKIV